MTTDRRTRRRWSLTVVLAIVALVSAACGAGARDGAPVTVEGISASTSSGGSARMAMTMTMAFPQMGEMRVSMEGVTTLHSDIEQVRAAFTMAMDPTAFSQAMEGELRLIDGRMFARGDFVQTMGFPGTTDGWIELEGAQREAFLNFGTAPNPADPTMALDALLAVEGLEPAGREELRGADTRRFSARTTNAALLDAQGIDLEQALADQQAAAGQQPQTTPDELLEAVRDLPVELDIWIDDQDRLRRSRLQVDMSPMWRELLPEGERPEPGESTMVTDIEFYDYGTPVEVEIPDEAATATGPPPGATPAGGPTAGMAAQTATGTVTVDGGTLEGTHEAQGSCVTSALGQGIELGIHLTFVHDGEWATSMMLRVPFADSQSANGQLSAAVPESDGQPRSVHGTVTATVEIGPETERGAREFVDVTFDGIVDGHGITGEVSCLPG